MKLKDVLKIGLIGTQIEVVKAENKGLVGLKGKVIDESKNMIKIESHGKEKTLAKEQVVLHIYKDNRVYEVPGKMLVGRVEERIKNEN